MLKQRFDEMDCLIHQRAGWEPKHFFDKDELQSTGIDSPTFAELNKTYSYDKALNTTATKDKQEQLTFTLNKNNQITQVHNQQREQEQYRYDSCGYLTQQAQMLDWEAEKRLVQHSGIYQKGHKLNRINDDYYRYDNAGRLLEKTEIQNGFRQKTTYYRWNASNQLIGITTHRGEVWYYKYDGLGRRIAKECPQRDLKIEYLWDGDQLAYTQTFKNDELQSRRHCIFNGWQLLAQQDWYSELEQNHNGNIIHQRAETSYAITQPNGKVLALFNPQGRKVWAEEPKSIWGLRLNALFSYAKPSPLNPQMLFAGQWLDEESGLAYNRFRYYDPTTANYLCSDPIGLNGGSLPYFYVQNPWDFVDPFGLATCPTLTQDALGRITHAGARVTEDMIGTGTTVNKSARDYARSLGYETDDAGHILAKILGGQGGKGNVFPQLSSVNRGAYRDFEKSIRDYISSTGKDLDLKWQFEYKGNGTRPDSIIYEVFENGKRINVAKFGN